MEDKTFEVKPEHIKLIRRMCVGWNDCEFGAPEIDPKRPYGNSNVHQDMIEILGMKELRSGVFELELFGKKWLLKGEDKYNIYLDGAEEEEMIKVLDRLHEELEMALQIVLSAGTFEPGTYKEEDYGDWVKA